MKISSTQNSNFKPITLTVTIETLEEARALYELGNYGHNVQEMMTKKEFAPNLPYDDVLTHFYKELSKANLAGT
jgi:hypothetical protein